MPAVVTKISAVGTRGEAKGKVFTAKKDSAGRYVLHKKVSARSSTEPTNKAINKVYVETLSEAADLL